MRLRTVAAGACLLALSACGQAAGSGAGAQTTPSHSQTGTVVAQTGTPTVTAPGASPSGSGVQRTTSTQPRAYPAVGNRRTAFVVRLTSHAQLGAHGAILAEYRVVGTGPAGAGCQRTAAAAITRGAVGQRLRVIVHPSGPAWCQGKWRGEVVLERGPSCQSSAGSSLPTRCPEFASRILAAGRFVWQVR